MTPTFPADDRFVRLPEIKLRTGLSRTTIYRRIEEGGFPKPLKDGRVSVWRESAVLAYMGRVAAAG
jgi:prophage regulatory protein